MKVDRVNITKDNSPALVFLGILYLSVLISSSRVVAQCLRI